MIKSGHIRIRDKVYFEYYELEKPMKKDHLIMYDGISFSELMKEYEASKRSVEVSNFWREFSKVILMIINDKTEDIINNQPCKAEVKDNKAVIIELAKE